MSNFDAREGHLLRPSRLLVSRLDGESHPDYPVGIYKIIEDTFATEMMDPKSKNIGELRIGLAVYLMEVVVSNRFRRIRAKIAQPPGWITILRMEDGLQYVDKVETNAACAPIGKEPMVPISLSGLDYYSALECFGRFDSDGGGFLEACEFSRLITSHAQLFSRTIDVTQLISLLNNGGDGISVERFLAWIYSVPPASTMTPLSPKTPLSPGSPMSPVSPKRAKDSPGSLREPVSPKSATSTNSLARSTSLSTLTNCRLPPLMKGLPLPSSPFLLELVYGPDFELRELNHRFVHSCKHRLGNLVEVRQVLDPHAKGCTQAKLLKGTGIVMWSQATMLPFKDDPFFNMKCVDHWVKDFANSIIPMVIRVMNCDR